MENERSSLGYCLSVFVLRLSVLHTFIGKDWRSNPMSEQEQPPELLPCPWCGAVPEIRRIFDWEPEVYTVQCRNVDCPQRRISSESKDTTRKAWNTRPDAGGEVDVWNRAISIARESAKKSEAAQLDIAAVEILIRRLENARDGQSTRT